MRLLVVMTPHMQTFSELQTGIQFTKRCLKILNDFFQILPLFGICTTLSGLLKRKQKSQSVRYFCHMTAHSLIGYWVQSGTIPINPN